MPSAEEPVPSGVRNRKFDWYIIHGENTCCCKLRHVAGIDGVIQCGCTGPATDCEV